MSRDSCSFTLSWRFFFLSFFYPVVKPDPFRSVTVYQQGSAFFNTCHDVMFCIFLFHFTATINLKAIRISWHLYDVSHCVSSGNSKGCANMLMAFLVNNLANYASKVWYLPKNRRCLCYHCTCSNNLAKSGFMSRSNSSLTEWRSMPGILGFVLKWPSSLKQCEQKLIIMTESIYKKNE